MLLLVWLELWLALKNSTKYAQTRRPAPTTATKMELASTDNAYAPVLPIPLKVVLMFLSWLPQLDPQVDLWMLWMTMLECLLIWMATLLQQTRPRPTKNTSQVTPLIENAFRGQLLTQFLENASNVLRSITAKIVTTEDASAAIMVEHPSTIDAEVFTGWLIYYATRFFNLFNDLKFYHTIKSCHIYCYRNTAPNLWDSPSCTDMDGERRGCTAKPSGMGETSP